MSLLALVDFDYVRATRRVVGDWSRLISFPQPDGWILDPSELEGYKIVYIDLHGEPRLPFLVTKRHELALHANTISRANFRGSVVIATTCWFPQTPLLDAFLDAGATAVIAGDGANYGNGILPLPIGAQHLAQYMIKFLRKGYQPDLAMGRAKHEVRRSWRHFLYPAATKDALMFKTYYGI